jgi:hypothetical protein
MVRVSKDEWIGILRDALRAAELEAESQALKVQNAALAAADAERCRVDAAAVLLDVRAASAGVQFNELEVLGLLADLPAAEDGSLDEVAFTMRVDTHVWPRWVERHRRVNMHHPINRGGRHGTTEA